MIEKAAKTPPNNFEIQKYFTTISQSRFKLF